MIQILDFLNMSISLTLTKSFLMFGINGFLQVFIILLHLIWLCYYKAFINFNETEGRRNDIILVDLNVLFCMFACKSNIIWSTPTLLWAAEYFWLGSYAYSPLRLVYKINSFEEVVYKINSFEEATPGLWVLTCGRRVG